MTICKIPNKSKLVFGSGGSKTIIAITPEKQVYKYFPILLYLFDGQNMVQELKNKFKYELYLLKKLTKYTKNKTPHIVNLYNIYYCNEIPKTFFKHCDKYIDYLLSKKPPSKECNYLYNGYPITLNKGMYIGELEFCSSGLNDEIKKIIKKPIHIIEEFLDRIIFQIVFTLEIIKKKYPYFIHGDLFIRNILCQTNNQSNKYYRYYLNNTNYDIPVTGVIVKLNDFGQAFLDKETLRKYNQNLQLRYSPYQDIFNILYDLYNGGNLGGSSLMSLTKNETKIKFIKKYFSNFMNVKIIDKIIKNNKKEHLDGDWSNAFDTNFIKLIDLSNSSQILEYMKNIYKYNEEHEIEKEFNL